MGPVQCDVGDPTSRCFLIGLSCGSWTHSSERFKESNIHPKIIDTGITDCWRIRIEAVIELASIGRCWITLSAKSIKFPLLSNKTNSIHLQEKKLSIYTCVTGSWAPSEASRNGLPCHITHALSCNPPLALTSAPFVLQQLHYTLVAVFGSRVECVVVVSNLNVDVGALSSSNFTTCSWPFSEAT